MWLPTPRLLVCICTCWHCFGGRNAGLNRRGSDMTPRRSTHADELTSGRKPLPSFDRLTWHTCGAIPSLTTQRFVHMTGRTMKAYEIDVVSETPTELFHVTHAMQRIVSASSLL